MSLSVDGVWKAGVWATTVWADGVWREGAPPEPEPEVVVAQPSGGWEERYPMPHAPWLRKPEEEPEALQEVQAAAESPTPVDEVTEPLRAPERDYEAIAAKVEEKARDAFAKEYEKRLAEAKRKRRRRAAAMLLLNS